jgi:hypothetical protein
MAAIRYDDRVFPVGIKAMRRCLLEMRPDITVHGFRATFKTWATERTGFPREVIETALAHAVGNAVEAAYQRGDLFEKRRRLMRSLLRNLRGGIRLTLLLRVQRDEFMGTGEAFAALVLLNLLVLFLTAVADVGIRGELSYQELPRVLMAVPLLLAFGLIAVHITGDRQALLTLAVALMAAAAVINFGLGLLGLALKHAGLPARYWQWVFYLPTSKWPSSAIRSSSLRAPAIFPSWRRW